MVVLLPTSVVGFSSSLFNKNGITRPWILNVSDFCVLQRVGTYILLTSPFAPCILPMMVPCLEFFTHPLMPSAMQLSLQCFVNPHPGEGNSRKWYGNRRERKVIKFIRYGTQENSTPVTVLLRTLIMLHVSWEDNRWSRVTSNKLQLATRCCN